MAQTSSGTDPGNLSALLSEQEKQKIRSEEAYRREVANPAKPNKGIGLEGGLKILQGLAIIIGIWATYNEFRKQNDARRDAETDRQYQTAREYRKYFYQKQLDLYAEAVEAAAVLATEDIASADYKKAKKDFYRLFWGKMSMVEDKVVEQSMIWFKDALEQYESGEGTADRSDLRKASLNLAHEARAYTLDVWIDKADRARYN